jgi:hypothetical protein
MAGSGNTEEIRIQAGVDASSAVKGAKDFEGAVQKMADSATASGNKSAAALEKATKASRNIGAQSEVLARRFFQSGTILAGSALLAKQGLESLIGPAASLEEQIDAVNDAIDRTGASSALMVENFLSAGLALLGRAQLRQRRLYRRLVSN